MVCFLIYLAFACDIVNLLFLQIIFLREHHERIQFFRLFILQASRNFDFKAKLLLFLKAETVFLVLLFYFFDQLFVFILLNFHFLLFDIHFLYPSFVYFYMNLLCFHFKLPRSNLYTHAPLGPEALMCNS